MMKNRSKRVELDSEIRRLGNWNRNFPDSKPIVEIIIDDDRFVFKHEEILKLIGAYLEADLESIKMIKEGKAGEIKNFETPLHIKIERFIKEKEVQK